MADLQADMTDGVSVDVVDLNRTAATKAGDERPALFNASLADKWGLSGSGAQPVFKFIDLALAIGSPGAHVMPPWLLLAKITDIGYGAREIRKRDIAFMACSVYVIGSPRGPQKIGVALNVARRLGALQTGSSVKLIASLVEPMATPEAKLVEAHAHWLLRDSRLSGEWFRVTPTDAGRAVREAIEAVARGDAQGRSAVGRPKMDVKPMLVRLPEGMAEQIDALAGQGKRAEFIRDAVEREIKRRSRLKD